MEQRLSVITLGVGNLKKSREFYESLGWKVASEEKESEEIVAFNLRTFCLVLYPIEALAKDTLVNMALQKHPTVTLAYNVSSQEEVDKTIEYIRNAGAEIVKEPQKVFWGGYSSYFSDPNGYLWEVVYSPGSPLGKNGEFKWNSTD